DESRISGEIGPARLFAEALILPIVAHGEDEPAIRRREELIRDDLQVRIALSCRNFATGEIRLGDVDLRGDGAVEKGEVDRVAVPAPLARVQTGEYGGGGVQAGEDVGDGNAHLRRRAFDGSGDIHQAAERLHGIVVAG